MPDALTDRVTATVDAVQAAAPDGDGDPLHSCSHVLTGAIPRVLCIEHPAAGVLCADCAEEHAARAHGDDATCDLCGAEDVEDVRWRDPAPVEVAAVRVRHPSALLTPATLRDAPVHLWGVAACPPCAAEASS